jgi:carboxymethylenebutenolidase
MSHMLELCAAEGQKFPVYLGQSAQPTGRAPTAAVIVLQEIFGVNNHIRAVADRYATQGYLALAPDMFHRVQPGVSLGYTPGDVATGRDLKMAAEALPAPGVQQDIQATIHYAAALCGGKVAVLGYCWGGLLTWRAAEQCTGLSAAVPYYGGGMTVGQEPQRHPKCPVLCHFGEQDQGIPMDTVQAFAQLQTPAGVRTETYAAGHGFHCEQRGSYDATAAERAWTRTLAFLALHLAV